MTSRRTAVTSRCFVRSVAFDRVGTALAFPRRHVARAPLGGGEGPPEQDDIRRPQVRSAQI